MNTKRIKKSYSEARLEVAEFSAYDVITTSGALDTDGSGESGNLGEWTPPEW